MPAPNVTLRHLKVFLEIVRQGNLNRASQTLHITQSAVSKSLKELEAELHSTLIERGHKGVVLTPQGEAFHLHATQTLLSYTKAIDIAQGAQGERERLRIGALPTAAGSIVPQVVKALGSHAGQFFIHVESGPYDYLVSLLRTGTIDLIVGRMINRDTIGLAFEMLYEEDIAVVVRKGHPLETVGTLTLEHITDYPMMLPSAGSMVRGAIEDFFFANGVKPPLQPVESSSESFSRAYVYDYDAVWIVPFGVAHIDLRDGRLFRLPFTSPFLKAPIGLTTQTLSPLPRAAQVFVERLRQFHWQA